MILLQNKAIRSALGGALGGFLAWVFSEPLALVFFRPPLEINFVFLFDAIWAAPIGLMLGLVLGAAEGISLRSVKIALRGAAIGMVVGLFGGPIGVVIAEIVFQQVKWLGLIGRGMGWSVFGLFLGLQEGIRRHSLKGTRNAAIGGWIGGFVGGVLFDLVGTFTSSFGSSTLSRGIALVVLGACIGILVALVEHVLADGAFQVTLGRFEGREILLDRPTMIVGSDEHNDIYLPDKGVLPRHAQVRAEGGGFEIAALSGSITVNHTPVTRQALAPGDQVEIGAARLRYRTRRRDLPAAAGTPRPPVRVPTPPPAARRPDFSPSAPLAPAMVMCPRCAHMNRAGAKFCSRCGETLR